MYGYPSLWLIVFVAAIGAPLPINLLLLAGGAFAALGDFNIVLLALVTISASVCGDNVGYLLGRKWGSKGLGWLEHSRTSKRLLSQHSIVRSRAFFTRYGGWAIFFSRFLVGALGGIINLLAGSERFSYRLFLALDIAGETLGAVLPLILGFIFGASWEALGTVLSTVSLLVLSVLAAILLLIRLVKYLHTSRTKPEASVDDTNQANAEPLDEQEIVSDLR